MSTALDVLIVEDSENDALLIAEELREGGYEPRHERVESRDAVAAALRRRHWDIIIADYSLPGFSGLSALQVVREIDPDVPFIIVSGQITEDTAVEAMRAGAQDYVLKDNLARLAPAVQRELREAEIRRERRRAEEAFRESEDKFRTLFECMAVGVVYYDTEGRPISVNPAAERLFGMTADQLIGMSPQDLRWKAIHTDGSEFTWEMHPVAVALKTEHSVQNVVMGVFNQEEHTYRWFIANAILQFRPGENKPHRVFATYDDITESVEEHRLSDSLADINSRISSTLDIDEIMRRTLEEASRTMGAQMAAVYVREEDRWAVNYAYAMESLLGMRFDENEAPYSTEAARSGKTVAIENVPADSRANQSIQHRYGIRSALAVPLIIKDEVIGTIVFNFSAPAHFARPLTDFANKLGTTVSLALANARLYDELQRSRQSVQQTLDREIHFSRLLQRALVPITPTSMDGYAAASTYIPAFATREIGGDFYDLFETEAGKIGVLIGDVSGKGLEAAAFAAACRNTIRAFAYESSSAVRALTHANAVLSSNQEAFGPFATVSLAIIDPATGNMRYSSAGHPPAAICRANGDVQFLLPGNMPVGLFLHVEFYEAESSLAPGEKMVLYTDGITEARHDSKLFGDEGIERVLKEYGSSKPDELISHLVDAATDWANGHLRDDTAVLVVERCPVEETGAQSPNLLAQ